MADSKYIDELRALPNYMTSSEIIPAVQWKPFEGGHVLVTKENQDVFIGVGVVYVYDNKLNCGPNGNYIKPGVGSLENAKYQLQARRPPDSIFGADFPTMYNNLDKLMKTVAVSKDQPNDLLIKDVSAKIIRFARPVFEKRLKEVSIPSHEVYLEDVMDMERSERHDAGEASDEKEIMDEETMNWPMPPGKEFAAALQHVQPFYRAVPLRVYKENNTFVEPEEVNQVLKEATIEVQFSLRHIFLANQTPSCNSFCANIEQIVILKPARPSRSVYKNIDPRAGPIKPAAAVCMKRRLELTGKEDEGASGSNTGKRVKTSTSDKKGKKKAVDEDVSETGVHQNDDENEADAA